MLEFFRISGLFVITALAEIVGCYLPWLVLTQERSVGCLSQPLCHWQRSLGCSRCILVLPGVSMQPMAASMLASPCFGFGRSTASLRRAGI